MSKLIAHCQCPQRFFIGFKFGDRAGQLITQLEFFWKHSCVNLAEWACVLSCWNNQVIKTFLYVQSNKYPQQLRIFYRAETSLHMIWTWFTVGWRCSTKPWFIIFVLSPRNGKFFLTQLRLNIHGSNFMGPCNPIFPMLFGSHWNETVRVYHSLAFLVKWALVLLTKVRTLSSAYNILKLFVLFDAARIRLRSFVVVKFCPIRRLFLLTYSSRFRRYTRTTLRKRPNWSMIHELLFSIRKEVTLSLAFLPPAAFLAGFYFS